MPTVISKLVAGDREKTLELFNKLTEACDELLDMGFEDIYQDTREQIAATVDACVLLLLALHTENEATSTANETTLVATLLTHTLLELTTG